MQIKQLEAKLKIYSFAKRFTITKSTIVFTAQIPSKRYCKLNSSDKKRFCTAKSHEFEQKTILGFAEGKENLVQIATLYDMAQSTARDSRKKPLSIESFW